MRASMRIIMLAAAGAATSAAVRPAPAADAAGAKVLPVRALATPADARTATDPASALWGDVPEAALHVNRTPPMFAGGPSDDGARPTVTVRAARLPDGNLVVRLRWTDATQDLARAGERYPDAGEEHAYPRHSQDIAAFADALCVMLPRERVSHTQYPSIMMGDAAHPVDLYFWRAGVGFSALKAAGLSTVEATTASVSGKAVRDPKGWTAALLVGKAPPRTPICFAVWDGAKEHRDGLKYFSLWYEVQ